MFPFFECFLRRNLGASSSNKPCFLLACCLSPYLFSLCPPLVAWKSKTEVAFLPFAFLMSWIIVLFHRSLFSFSFFHCLLRHSTPVFLHLSHTIDVLYVRFICSGGFHGKIDEETAWRKPSYTLNRRCDLRTESEIDAASFDRAWSIFRSCSGCVLAGKCACLVSNSP